MNHYSFTNATEPLPEAVWVPSGGTFRIYRGSPGVMVKDMVPDDMPLREALKKLTEHFAQNHQVVIQLPWGQPDEVIAALFLHALIELGIGRAVASA